MESERYLLNEEAMRQYIVQGYVTVQADMPAGYHQEIVRRLDTVLDTEGNWGNNILPRIPEIRQVFQHPAVDGALTSILGPNYILHPHRYPHCNLPGSAAQALHKGLHSLFRRCRYPTSSQSLGDGLILPSRGYGRDGADLHPARGTPYYEEHSHDPDNAELLLCGQAGTVTIVNFDIWHRATANRSQKRRYMLKFIFARTEEPGVSARHTIYPDWSLPRNADNEKHPLAWRYLWNWIREKPTAVCDAVPIGATYSIRPGIAERGKSCAPAGGEHTRIDGTGGGASVRRLLPRYTTRTRPFA